MAPKMVDLPPKWSIPKKRWRHVRRSKGTQEAEPGGHVSGTRDMSGQENNSTKSGYWYMMGQAFSREKVFVQILGQV